ncbi:hypothetical protein, partial [Mycobacterium intermedium]|uniref:hypothetical protein n=1 Tax=Mycobacterium intermedium TaxID=28445 RepID=UPI0039ED73BC
MRAVLGASSANQIMATIRVPGVPVRKLKYTVRLLQDEESSIPVDRVFQATSVSVVVAASSAGSGGVMSVG